MVANHAELADLINELPELTQAEEPLFDALDVTLVLERRARAVQLDIHGKDAWLPLSALRSLDGELYARKRILAEKGLG